MEGNTTASTSTTKQTMTEEERRQLAEKLDKELVEYIASRENRPYTEGWPEDRWEEEMEKHPFFMTKTPEPGEELSPLLQGIQQLKYDESENTPEELATTYKEDGNFNFKCKKYRLAVVIYTEGLRQKCSDVGLNAQLYNNRAAAHFFLKNYRSCLNDCRAALRLQSPYPKALSRAAQCCYHLQRYDDCITFCDEILAASPTEVEALDFRSKATSCKKKQESKARKIAAARKKEKAEDQVLLQAIQDRGIRVCGHEGEEILSLSALEAFDRNRVHLSSGCLVWPVLFLYPEYKTVDLVQEFHEDSTFLDRLSLMFESCPDWDEERKYNPPDLHIYFEERSTGQMCPISSDSTLGTVLSDQRYIVFEGSPTFFVVVAGSKAEHQLLKN